MKDGKEKPEFCCIYKDNKTKKNWYYIAESLLQEYYKDTGDYKEEVVFEGRYLSEEQNNSFTIRAFNQTNAKGQRRFTKIEL